jgi:hypothetical protein
MRALLAACLALVASPAIAETCTFVAEHGSKLITGKPGGFMINEADGGTDECTLYGNGTGIPIMRGVCESAPEFEFAFFDIASKLGGERDIIIYHNTAWYLQGCEN